MTKQNIFTNRPYNLFLFTSVLIGVSSLFMLGQSLDIHLHDTYYVFPTTYLLWAITLLLILAWTIYKLTDSVLLTKKLTWFHVISTLVVLLILGTSTIWYDNSLPTNAAKSLLFSQLLEIKRKEQIIVVAATMLFVTGQIAYLINLSAGLLRQR